MDRLETVLKTLWEQIPRCSICSSDCCVSQIYVTFTCLHFICLECVKKGNSYTSCIHHPIAQQIGLESEILLQHQHALSYNLDLFFNQKNAVSFSAACDAFYNLLNYMSTGTPITVPPNVSEGESQQYPREPPPVHSLHQPAPNSGTQPHQNLFNFDDPSLAVPWACPICKTGVTYPANQVGCPSCRYVNLKAVGSLRVEVWKCECGVTSEKGKTCPCGRSAAYVSPTVISTTRTNVSLPSHNQLVWTCPKCSYEYNQRSLHNCLRCECPNPQPEEVKVEKVRSSVNAWKCKECGYPSNFLLDVCSKCNAPRPQPEPAQRQQHVSLQPVPTGVKIPNGNQKSNARDDDSKPPEYQSMTKSQKKKWRKLNKK